MCRTHTEHKGYKLLTENPTDTGKEGERHHFKDQGEL
jgi:hypothetical protein